MTAEPRGEQPLFRPTDRREGGASRRRWAQGKEGEAPAPEAYWMYVEDAGAEA